MEKKSISMQIKMCCMAVADIVDCDLLLCALKWKKMLMMSPCQKVMNTTPVVFVIGVR